MKILDLIKFKSLNTHSSSMECSTWIMTIFVDWHIFKCCEKILKKIVINLHVLMRWIIVLREPKATWTSFFIAILNMDSSKSKLNANINLLTSSSTSSTSIFFRKQNKDFTTLRSLLKDSWHYVSIQYWNQTILNALLTTCCENWTCSYPNNFVVASMH